MMNRRKGEVERSMIRHHKQKRLPILMAVVLLTGLGTRVRAQSVEGVRLPVYNTQYYEIHTDLTGDDLREAELRMTKMAEEYRQRTRMFFPAAERRLPFYLFRRAQDYYATGAPEESAGVFIGSALLALAGDKADLQTWHVIQHEGFHQYAYSAIGSNLPIWLNEGMAEYFGEGLFTGEGFVTGLIPPWRLDRIRKALKAGDFVPLHDMMNLPTEQWNAKLSVNNYDQAWSMVQFLARGDDGRYQRPFTTFIAQVGRGKPWQKAWQDNFGDINLFEKRWKDYWTHLPDDPTQDLYAQTAMRILTSFLGRAYDQHQQFTGFTDFSKALHKQSIQIAAGEWLPPALGSDGLDLAKTLGSWTLEPGLLGQPPHLSLVMKDGTRMTGRFTLSSQGVPLVHADIERATKHAATQRDLTAAP